MKCRHYNQSNKRSLSVNRRRNFLGAKAPLEPTLSEDLYMYVCMYVCNTLGIIKYIMQLPSPLFRVLNVFKLSRLKLPAQCI